MKRDGSTVADYSYNSRNLTTAATFGNGVELTNQHDNLGRMTERSYNKDGNTIAGFAFDYDEVGNKLYQEDLRDSQQSELYGYDNRDRLTSWERGELKGDKDGIVTTETDQNWNLDSVGNWDLTTIDGVTEQRDHNAVNELTHRENGITADLRYDDNGNLIEDSEYEYAYDAFNRLVEVTRKTNDKVIATYSYDTQNRRTKKKTGSASGPPVSVEYAYDGWQIVEEHITRGGGGGNGQGRGKGKGKGNGQGGGNGNGQGGGNGGGSGGETVRTYVYGNYIDDPITMTASGAGRSGTYYYHTNNLYNVRALTDSNGDVVERYRYTAYGEPTIYDDQGNEIQSSAVGNPYMFQGRRMDEETGLYYYRNRYYSAELGRFVTRDPMGYVDGFNLYAYVGNGPTNYGDPFGWQAQKYQLGTGAYLGVGASATAALETDHEPCCNEAGERLEAGLRNYKLDFTIEAGIGIGGKVEVPIPWRAGKISWDYLAKGPQLQLRGKAKYSNEKCGGEVKADKMCASAGYSPEWSATFSPPFVGEASIVADGEVMLQGCAKPHFDAEMNVTKVTLTLKLCVENLGTRFAVWAGPYNVVDETLETPTGRLCFPLKKEIDTFK